MIVCMSPTGAQIDLRILILILLLVAAAGGAALFIEPSEAPPANVPNDGERARTETGGEPVKPLRADAKILGREPSKNPFRH